MHPDPHAHTHAYPPCMHTLVHICAHVRVPPCMHMYSCMHMHTHVCMCACQAREGTDRSLPAPVVWMDGASGASSWLSRLPGGAHNSGQAPPEQPLANKLPRFPKVEKISPRQDSPLRREVHPGASVAPREGVSSGGSQAFQAGHPAGPSARSGVCCETRRSSPNQTGRLPSAPGAGAITLPVASAWGKQRLGSFPNLPPLRTWFLTCQSPWKPRALCN